ncbi:SseB family protein [Pseudogemmobacter humi]|uniref:Uncharacterized protein n=1 Tax=Pseudogemmobacter humi TaxID=2483812 RepID=A0A3P5XF51_9RHOB|nr:SseB family protein [Pseudogemmobacter humi]VDC33387.1 hypothetical protein XINFAN_03803 [Pseudogemmobacter humi]
MSDVLTLLDAAHAAVSADPASETARLRFYERLADGELFLLLEREAVGEKLDPKVFDLESGPVVLVFDREERLAEFSGGIAPWAALPGRVIAGLLKGQGIGLGVNLGVAPSAMLLPPEAMDWLAETLEGEPDEAVASPGEFFAPSAPGALIAALDGKLARAGGLAGAAFLAGVRWQDGRRGHLLAFTGAAEGAQAALARAVREALVFSGIEAGELDVAFLSPDDKSLAALARVALRFDLPEPEAPAVLRPVAPGSDPDKPPRLR